jgi:hypothetical protein
VHPRPILLALTLLTLAAVVAAACSSSSSGGSSSPAAATRTVHVFAVAKTSAALPVALERSAAALDGGTVYVAGGLTAAQASVNTVYSIASGKVTKAGTVPDAFHDGAATMIGGKLVLFGGGQSEGTDLVQAFDPSTGAGSVIGHLPMALSDLAAAQVGGTTYVLGGWTGTTYNSTIWSTTDGKAFKVVGHLPQGLRYAAVAAAGNDIVIAGGEIPSGASSASIMSFDTATDQVSTVGTLPAAVAGASAVSIDSHVYVIGGAVSATGRAPWAVAVDPGAKLVTQVPGFGAGTTRVAYAATASDGTTGWIVGGNSGSAPTTQIAGASIRTKTVKPAAQTSSPSIAASATAAPTTFASGITYAPQAPNDWPVATSGPAAVRPFAGQLLIADRGVNKLLVVNAAKHVLWQYPKPGTTALIPFYFPDDGFFVHGGSAILLNEEENNMLAEITYPGGQKVWTYGHPPTAGSAPGYLYQPDDAYPYTNGGLVVADAKNCRILFFSPQGHPSGQIGKTGNCTPNLPKTVGYPNGDTVLPSGNILISELNGGAISEVTPTGQVVWHVHVPNIKVPSDPQPLPDGSFLSVDYRTPGHIVRFTSTGKVLWSYGPSSGPGELSHPSLAIPLPNGLVAVNDDYNHRVMLIDPATNKIVWQYGVTGVAGGSPPYLSYPDGMDLMLPGNQIVLHQDFPGPVTPGRP